MDVCVKEIITRDNIQLIAQVALVFILFLNARNYLLQRDALWTNTYFQAIGRLDELLDKETDEIAGLENLIFHMKKIINACERFVFFAEAGHLSPDAVAMHTVSILGVCDKIANDERLKKGLKSEPEEGEQEFVQYPSLRQFYRKYKGKDWSF